MRLILVAFALLSAGVSSAHQSRPKLIRVCLQFIEMPHPVLSELLAENETDGEKSHAKAIALSKEGKAKILETCLVLGRSGGKFSLESIREEIFPTEYQLPELPCHVPSTADSLTGTPPTNPMFRSPTAFETRNTGVTVEVETLLAGDERSIDVRISPDIVTPLRLETWMEYKDQWGDGSIRMPVYEAWRVNTSLTLTPGKFELVSAITPKSAAPVPAVLRKILVFVRADIVPVPTSK